MKDLHKSFPELNVEGGVNDGIDCAVHVSEPREGTVHDLWDFTVAVHVQNVGDEEREPTDDENTCRRTKKRGHVTVQVCHRNHLSLLRFTGILT